MTDHITPGIQNHKLFSVDIFDTLLRRASRTPIDAFTFMANEDCVQDVTGYFLDNRVAAENLARQDAADAGAEDVTLEQIYTCFAQITKCTPDQANAIKALELETELDLLQPTPFAKAFLAHVRETGKRYILASDMYLPSSALEHILNSKGISGWERLLVSGEIGRTKHTGTLFDDVVDHYGVPKGQILHIGDNPHADVAMAQKAGLSAHQVYASKDIPGRSPKQRKQSALLNGYKPMSQIFASDYFERNLDGKEGIDFRTLSDEDYLKTFGAIIVAPVMTSFLIWMKNHMDEKGINRIKFLARDGMFPKAAFDRLFPDRFDTEYIAASRRVLTIPFTVMKPGTIEGMFGATLAGCDTLEEFLNNIAAGPELVAYLEKNTVARATPLSKKDRKAILAALAADPEFLTGTFAAERDAITAYFRKAFPKGQTTALFDVGWRGSLQNAISEIVDPGAQINGFYFGTGWSAIEILQRNGHSYESYACSNGVPGFKSHRIEGFRDLIEFLCSADHGSVLRITQNDDEFDWGMAPLTKLEADNVKTAGLIQQGALEAITSVLTHMPVEILEKYASPDDVEDFWLFMERPHRHDALRFRDIRIFAGVGDTTGESLTQIGARRSHYQNVKVSRWRQAYGATLGKFTKARVNLHLKLRKRQKL